MNGKKNIYDIPIFATISLFDLGAIVAFNTDEAMSLMEWTQYWAFLVSASAFVWLVFGYLQQKKSIDIQNENILLQCKQLELNRLEIQAQQRQLELQRIEQQKKNFASSLVHIKEMIQIARNDYQPDNHIECPIYLNDGSKAILESTNPRVVTKNYMDWQEEYKPYQLYIKRIKATAEFYFMINDIEYNQEYDDTESFLNTNDSLISKIPYVSDAYETVSKLVYLNSVMVEFPSRATLAMKSAQWFISQDLIQTDQLHKDAAKFTESQLPAVYKKLVETQSKRQ